MWNTRFLPFWLLMWGFIAAMGAAELLRLAGKASVWAFRWISEGDLEDVRARAWADVALDDRVDIDPAVRHQAVEVLAERKFDSGPAGLGTACASRLGAARPPVAARLHVRARRVRAGRQRVRSAVRVERAQRQPVDSRRGLGAVQLRRLPEPARVAGVPVAHRDDGQAAARARALGGRQRRRQLRHDARRSSCCRTSRTGASTRWKVCTSSRRPRPRSTS